MKLVHTLAVVFFFHTFAFSTTIYVPDDYPTIQDAINAAVNGDEIVVRQGVYIENIDFLGKAITIKSEMGPETTIINGGSPSNPDYGSVVTFITNEGSDSVLDGFTITNGVGAKIPESSIFRYHGGGIYCRSSSPRILNNNIITNSADNGGGIYCSEQADPEIVNNDIRYNLANRQGGAIYCVESCLRAIDNTIIGNSWEGIWIWSCDSAVFDQNIIEGNRGGGIDCNWCSLLEFNHNLIVNNDGCGVFLNNTLAYVRYNKIFDNTIGLACDHSAVFIENCIVENNVGIGIASLDSYTDISSCIVSDNYGSGMHFTGYMYPFVVKNCTIHGNQQDSHKHGGGIGLTSVSPSSMIINCTISGNKDSLSGGGINCCDSNPIVSNTIIWENSAPYGNEIYECHGGNLTVEFCDVRGGWQGSGNIDADPLFVDAGGSDFHLTYNSPCKNSGLNSVQYLPSEDFEGDPRIVVDTVDMGADEFYYHLYHTGDVVPGGSIDINVIGYPLTPVILAWGKDILDPPFLTQHGDLYVPNDYRTIQDAIDAAINGDTVIVRPGSYFENIDFLGKSICVVSDRGPENTIINGRSSGLVATFQNGEGTDCTIEGFTLTNGRSKYGGGIYCYSQSSPNISSCVIQGNVAEWYGGGICCMYGSCPTISDCVFQGNASLFLSGGGIYCREFASPVIRNCLITENCSATSGGGISCFDSAPTISNCVVSYNSAYAYGGGVYFEGCSLTLTNNTIYCNTTDFFGGGVFSTGFGSSTISNTIIWDNDASGWPEIYVRPDSALVTFSDIKGGFNGVGNIDAEPLFADPVNGDFHLTWFSPCRDAGDNTVAIEPTDHEGDPRIALGTVDMGADEYYYHLYHMGDIIPGSPIDLKVVGYPTAPVTLYLGSGIADPPYSTQHGDFWLNWPPVWQGAIGNVPSDGLLVFPVTVPTAWTTGEEHPLQALVGPWGGSFTQLTNLEVLATDVYLPPLVCVPEEYPTIQEAINAAENGDTIIVRQGTYVENIDFLGKAITVKSKSGPAVTIIDGNQAGSVVNFENFESADSVLDGFTIRNGLAGEGGGIRCFISSPQITNNIITGNSADFGGGIRCQNNSNPLIMSNIIAGNQADFGAGIRCDGSWDIQLINNTLSGNLASKKGGGIYCGNTTMFITNTILWNNDAPEGPEVFLGMVNYPSTLTLSYSDLQGGQDSIYLLSGSVLNWGSGMIDADPLFATGPQGDYYLSQVAAGQSQDSPCVDSGDPASPVIEGTTRTDEEQDTGIVDMGHHYRIR